MSNNTESVLKFLAHQKAKAQEKSIANTNQSQLSIEDQPSEKEEEDEKEEVVKPTPKLGKVKDQHAFNKFVKSISNPKYNESPKERLNTTLDYDSYKFLYTLKIFLKIEGKRNANMSDLLSVCVDFYKEKNRKQLEELGMKVD